MRGQRRRRQRVERPAHARRIVVGARGASPQDDMRARIPAGLDDRGEALLGDTHEAMWLPCGTHRIDRDLNASIGAVLETDGHRESRRELAVHLTLGRARAYRGPRDEVAGVLRGDRIDELARRRNADLDEIEQQAARQTKTVVDPEGAVTVRVGHETFPADARSGLHEVGAHDDDEVVAQLVTESVQTPRVVERGDGIVDGARPDDRDEPVVRQRKDASQVVAPFGDEARSGLGQRQLLEDDRRRYERPVAGDAKVAGLHRTIVPDVPLYGYRGKTPTVAPDAFIAPTAVLIGDVTVETGASIWFGTVLRGDMDRIVIGARSNVQDNSTIHTDEGEPTLVGPDVTIGHNALVHSSVIARNVLIGQAAVLVGGNVIGEETIVGAGAVLPEGFSPPARSLVLGVPAKVVREVRPEDARWTVGAAAHYTELGRWYRENLK